MSGTASVRRTAVLNADAPVFTDQLLTLGIPDTIFWVQQTIGAIGCSIIPEWSARAITGALAPIDEWLPMMPPQIVPPGAGNPFYLRIWFPCRRVRLQMVRPQGQLTQLEIYIASGI